MRHNSKWTWLFLSRGRVLWPILILLVALLSPWRLTAAGTWVAVSQLAPNFIDTMLLLPDGTVMAASGEPISGGFGTNWYRLTPNSQGSYVNGTWSTLAPMHNPRLYFSSQVLPNGQVFVAGGEYSTDAFTGPGTTNAETYNPVANTWTVLPYIGANKFYDSCSEMLPNGNVLISPVTPAAYGGTVIWNTANNSWLAGPNLFRGDTQDEASWVKLPDNSILTIDPYGTNSERFIPSLNQWTNDANVPVTIYDTNSEMGPGILLPNGKAFFLGATGNTVLYTPSGNTSIGTWTPGPVLPNSQVTGDAPAVAMVNGKILYTTSSQVYGSPSYFYEYDPVANSFTQVNGPTGTSLNQVTYASRMLDLPDGTVLLSDSGQRLYVYQPDGSPLAAGKPAINTLTANNDGSYHLTGTLFNGITEGSSYGDDAQMNSNYPLVRMTNALGQVFYARTVNWSSTGVMTGTNIVSTDFVMPPTLASGTYSLVVAANGNASAPVSFIYSPDALYIVNPGSFSFSGTAGGPFTPSSLSFALTNISGASLNWSVGNTSTWLNVSSSSGTLTPGGASATISVSVTGAANSLPFGTYTTAIWITNVTDHAVQSRTFSLQVNPPQLVQNGGFETGDFTDWILNGDGNPDNFVDNGTTWYITPHSGTYFALMGEQTFVAYLSQSIPTVSGQPYLFSSWVNSPDGYTPTECSIAWNGNTLFNQANIGMLGWTNFQYIVTATNSSTTIQFGFQNAQSYFGLDDVSVTAVSKPMFQAVAKSGGSIDLTWSAMNGLAYQLQYTTNLIQGPWVNIGNPVNAFGGTASTTDTPPSFSPPRFYRLMLLP